MKSFRWLMLAMPLAASFVTRAQGVQDAKFVITGNVKGLEDQSVVFVTDISNPTDTLAKGVVKGSQFSLSGHIAETNIYELNFGSAKKKTPLFIGNDRISVSGTTDNMAGLEVKGSSTNDDFVEFQQLFNPFFMRLNELMKLGNSPEGAMQKDSLHKVYNKTVDSVQGQVDAFIARKKGSFVSPFVLLVLNQLTEDPTVQERRLASLSTDVQSGYYGQYLKKQLDEAKVGAIGTQAIEFAQADTSGRSVSLSSFKGKYVLVDFWASWCGPCRMENPNVVNTYQKFKNKNFTVLGVSLDKAKAPWVAAIKADGLQWTQVSDLKFWSNEVAVKYHIQSIPQNFLIDPNGKIVGRNLRGPDLQAKLCELLGCN